MFMAMVDPKLADLMGHGETIEEAKEVLLQTVWDWRILEGDTEADIEDSVNSVMEDIEIYKKQHRAIQNTIFGGYFWQVIYVKGVKE